MLCGGSIEVWWEALNAVADELLSEAGCSGPPIDALRMAGRLGVVVAFDSAQAARGRHKRLGGEPTIFLKPDSRPERLQWAAAHELGEVVACRVFARAASQLDEMAGTLRERVANLLASRLLLPGKWFVRDVRRVRGDIAELKARYQTASHELIAYRLLDLPEPSIVTIFDQGRATRRRSNFAGPLPGLLEVEVHCWREVHDTGRHCEMSRPRLVVQGWPVHEEGWKREILRTTLDRDQDCQELPELPA